MAVTKEYYVLGCEKINYKGEKVLMFFKGCRNNITTDRLSELPIQRKYNTYKEAQKALNEYNQTMNKMLNKVRLWQKNRKRIRNIMKDYDTACYRYLDFISCWSLDDEPKIIYSLKIYKVELMLSVEQVT